ncbi:hypothetical protein [Pseudomonas fluorescens]|uniref:hypothetical protein n=1 Tax=Pseudomonas fluorescens TaxID=294 RepID=UPI003823541F
MTEQQQVQCAEKRRVGELFWTETDPKLVAFREFWRTKCEMARDRKNFFLQVMSGEQEVSFAKIAELEEHYLKLCQYEHALSNKARDVLLTSDVLTAVHERINDADEWKRYARECLVILRSWSLPPTLANT